MNLAALERIADAVLYEGYMLYPYRASSLKNRQRWNFGTLSPRSFAERQSPPEPFSFQAEVLVAGSGESRITACTRYLRLTASADENPLEWHEGVPRSHMLEHLALADLIKVRDFDLACSSAGDGPVSTMIAARLTLHAQALHARLWRLRAVLSNETELRETDRTSIASAQKCACVSAHLLLGVEDGAFVSLLEPDPEYLAEVSACVNRGVFPVLAGEGNDRSRMLCSPIILYDCPQVAPESAGDFFDGTEMDEMLALRVLTLTDAEKGEIRAGDPHAAAILARTETLPGEHLLKLHGAVRGMRQATPPDRGVPAVLDPWNPFEEKPPRESVHVFGVEVHCSDRVRLWPRKKADILDMAMRGKVAVIEAIEQDLEGNVQFAVVLEDDPGRDMGMLRQAGHRFFFKPEEIELLRTEVP